jgi:hypothetical protein
VIGIVAMPPVGPKLAGAPTNPRTAKAANTAKRFDPWATRRTARARGAELVGGRMIWVDRTAPKIHHTMTAARAKPQFSDPTSYRHPPNHSDGGTRRVSLPAVASVDARLREATEVRAWLTSRPATG